MAATSMKAVGAWLSPERRPLTVLLSTSFVSLISNQLTALAVPWFVLVLTGSATKMGITAAATLVPAVVMTFLGGAIADRTNERHMSAFADILSGVTVALVPLLYVLGYLNFPILLALMVAGAVFDTPGNSARAKLVPKLAEKGGVKIERVTSLQGAFNAVSTLFGAILAGVLISTMGATNVLWINAAAFALSAITMLLLIPEMHIKRDVVPSMLEDIRIGLRYVRKSSLVSALIVAALVINGLLAPFMAVLLPYLAKTEWDSATRYGLMVSGFGAGALIGSVVIGALTERVRRSIIVRVSIVLLTLPSFSFVIIPGIAIAWASAFLIGIGIGMINPLINALMYRVTDPEILGRVLGVIGAGAMVTSPLGILLVTPFLEQFGLASSFLVIAASLALFGGWMLFFSPFMREVDAVSESIRPVESREATT